MLKKVIWLIILIALLIFTVPKILEQLSLWFAGRNGDDQVEEVSGDILFPPILDTLPVATNSAEITIRGFAQNADRVEIFINDIKKETATIGTKDGSFVVIR